MRKIVTTLLLVLFTLNINAQNRKEFFKSPKGVFLISSDLHIHSVFSDGEVWPSIRIKEARRDGLDLISLTEHLEYLSYKNDMNITDRNRSFEISSSMLKQEEALMVINGELSHDDLFEKSLYATRQLAKRQCTWIRGWENLQTYDVDEFDQATKQLKKQLNFA